MGGRLEGDGSGGDADPGDVRDLKVIEMHDPLGGAGFVEPAKNLNRGGGGGGNRDQEFGAEGVEDLGETGKKKPSGGGDRGRDEKSRSNSSSSDRPKRPKSDSGKGSGAKSGSSKSDSSKPDSSKPDSPKSDRERRARRRTKGGQSAAAT